MLAAAASGGLQPAWHALFCRLPMDQLQLAQASALLRELNTRPQLAPRYGHGAACFARALLLSSPHLPHAIAAELAAAPHVTTEAGPTWDGNEGCDGAGSLWSELESFIVRALQPPGGGKAADETFAELLRLLCELVAAAPPLLDSAWHLLVHALAPAAQSEASRAALEQQAAALPWHLLGRPLAEGRVAPDLLQARPPATVCARACNRMRARLQPHARPRATVCARACDRMCAPATDAAAAARHRAAHLRPARLVR